MTILKLNRTFCGSDISGSDKIYNDVFCGFCEVEVRLCFQVKKKEIERFANSTHWREGIANRVSHSGHMPFANLDLVHTGRTGRGINGGTASFLGT